MIPRDKYETLSEHVINLGYEDVCKPLFKIDVDNNETLIKVRKIGKTVGRPSKLEVDIGKLLSDYLR